MGKIRLVEHPHALNLKRSREDHATVTNQDLVERPWWYENTETGQCYYDIYGCIGWPTEITNTDDGLPGYAAIVGVVKSDKENTDASEAKFQLLAEAESKEISVLLSKCLELREEYGFGIQRDLLTTWLGDPERFLVPLALINEELIKDGDVHAILLTPPDEMYTSKVFDMYVRALRSALCPETIRLYPGYNYILQNKLMEFYRGDPCIFAMGGLVFSLLNRCVWMDSQSEGIFAIEEDE